ncbi:hypothetical protein ACP70R_047559 [Stipagrostis hirtigluma subsp. patula]
MSYPVYAHEVNDGFVGGSYDDWEESAPHVEATNNYNAGAGWNE